MHKQAPSQGERQRSSSSGKVEVAGKPLDTLETQDTLEPKAKGGKFCARLDSQTKLSMASALIRPESSKPEGRNNNIAAINTIKEAEEKESPEPTVNLLSSLFPTTIVLPTTFDSAASATPETERTSVDVHTIREKKAKSLS